MAWIRVLDEAEVLDPARAQDLLTRLYRTCVDPRTQRVDNVLKVHSLAPQTMDGHVRLYRSVMHTAGETTPRQRELLGVAVSAANGCGY